MTAPRRKRITSDDDNSYWLDTTGCCTCEECNCGLNEVLEFNILAVWAFNHNGLNMEQKPVNPLIGVA